MAYELRAKRRKQRLRDGADGPYHVVVAHRWTPFKILPHVQLPEDADIEWREVSAAQFAASLKQHRKAVAEEDEIKATRAAEIAAEQDKVAAAAAAAKAPPKVRERAKMSHVASKSKDKDSED